MSVTAIFRQLPQCGARHVVRLPSTPMKSRLVIAAMIVVGITAVVSAQTPSVEVIWARQPDSPLRVVRIDSTLTNPIREIAVQNASKVDINSYQLGWVPVVPPGCGTSIKASVKLLPSVEGPVWPSIGESARAYDFDKGEILETARRQGSPKIVVEVLVVKVELANGWWNDSGDDIPDPVPVQRFACKSEGVIGGQKGRHQPSPELIGTWDYAAMTALKNGKPFGTVHFQPGQWTVTFNQDATWAMKPPSPPATPGGLSGSYAVHGHDVDMRLPNGRICNTYRFTVEQDGKALTLTTKGATISASREQ